MATSSILLIVEGEKTEPALLGSLLNKFQMTAEFVVFKTNIYALYKILKKANFMLNIKDVLIAKYPGEKQKLSRNFTYTYLVFDCDAHHPRRNETRNRKQIFMDNFYKLEEMSKHFTDETDPTIGKLYINYPMIESFRDCDNFFDKNYSMRSFSIYQTNYKKWVGQRKLCGRSIDKFTKDEFSKLMLQNIYKANEVMTSSWSKPSYGDYKKQITTEKICSKEHDLVKTQDLVMVLNTCLLLVVDYFGNTNGFYDSL